MINIIKYEEKYSKQVYDLFMNFRDEEDFFKEFTYEGFCAHLFKNSAFKAEGTFVALDGEEVVGFASGMVKDADDGKENASAYLHTFFVKKEYRRQGIGSQLLEKVETYAKEKGRTSMRFVFVGQINWPWYIPNTDHHMHPGMPCVRINSDFYIFLYHHGYYVNSIHEGFHLPLAQYEMPQSVVKKMEENAQRGLVVEIYDPAKHYGIDEFCEVIQNAGFAASIKNNLKRDVPRPFLVASNNGKVVGWTGAMYVEETGRGHLDGIIVDPNERKAGLGKGLFCNLCKHLKEMGASYMTFFTGLDNPARYIYLGAGFQVAQSFADMKKELK
jgi:ribosomal protein S18 acetylase RimI-like enzyme